MKFFVATATVVLFTQDAFAQERKFVDDFGIGHVTKANKPRIIAEGPAAAALLHMGMSEFCVIHCLV